MGIVTAILGILLLVLAIRQWNCEKQLADWAKQLTETDENSNLRLCTSVRSRAFRHFCRAINARLEKGQQMCIRQKNVSRELKFTLSCMSHDIRTPLTGAAGYLQLLDKVSDTQVQKDYILVIRRRLGDLENLLEELFLFTKLSNEEYHIECEEIVPFPALCDVLAGFYQKLTAAGMEPDLDFPEEGQTVYASGEALRRIFSNLVQNALRYGSGRLEIRQEGKDIRFANPVENPDELDAERLFERFYRADPSRHLKGAGLGLASVKGIMEKMGGSVCAAVREKKLIITLHFQ